MGSVEDLQFVDSESVLYLQSRAPGASQRDFEVVSSTIVRKLIFKGLSDEQKRMEIISRLSHIKHLIPSIYTLQQDCKYVRQCGYVLKRLILGKSCIMQMRTVREMAVHAFKSGADDSWEIHSPLFLGRLKLLYLHIMQDLVALSGEHCLMEDNELRQEPLTYDQKAWVELAGRAVKLGFKSNEISRLACVDADREIFRKMFLDARPPPAYEYDESELEGTIMSIIDSLNRTTRLRRDSPSEASLTSAVGEKMSRRCGRQYSAAYARDRHCYTPNVVNCKVGPGKDVTSLFVWRSIFHAFWGSEDIDEDLEAIEVDTSSDTTDTDTAMDTSNEDGKPDKNSNTHMKDAPCLFTPDHEPWAPQHNNDAQMMDVRISATAKPRPSKPDKVTKSQKSTEKSKATSAVLGRALRQTSQGGAVTDHRTRPAPGVGQELPLNPTNLRIEGPVHNPSSVTTVLRPVASEPNLASDLQLTNQAAIISNREASTALLPPVPESYPNREIQQIDVWILPKKCEGLATTRQLLPWDNYRYSRETAQ